METKRITLYLDKYIVDTLDSFIKKYTPQSRGRVINIVLGIYVSQDPAIQQEYMELAKRYAKERKDETASTEHDDIQKGKKRVNLFVTDYLYEKLNKEKNEKPKKPKNEETNKEKKKMLVLAALLYVGLLQ